jgi:hypothetical protein
MPKIGADTVVSRGSDHVETQLSGDTVMMSISRGKYFAVGGTGQRIWECMSEPLSIGEIVSRLVAEYDVDRDRCEAEVLAFVGTLIDNGLTVECDR